MVVVASFDIHGGATEPHSSSLSSDREPVKRGFLGFVESKEVAGVRRDGICRSGQRTLDAGKSEKGTQRILRVSDVLESASRIPRRRCVRRARTRRCAPLPPEKVRRRMPGRRPSVIVFLPLPPGTPDMGRTTARRTGAPWDQMNIEDFRRHGSSRRLGRDHRAVGSTTGWAGSHDAACRDTDWNHSSHEQLR